MDGWLFLISLPPRVALSPPLPNPPFTNQSIHPSIRYIGSDNHNLKYLGVKGLAAIVKDHPRYAAQHQVNKADGLLTGCLREKKRRADGFLDIGVLEWHMGRQGGHNVQHQVNK